MGNGDEIKDNARGLGAKALIRSNAAGDDSVGASLLAKDSRAPRSFRMQALSLTIIASTLAPTAANRAASAAVRRRCARPRTGRSGLECRSGS
ncbi:hypothetical protein C1886_22600 [Pseudomonas sp. FW300-N1A1]|nr:hypothetical protein C1886_22600 [Pseudomonas sp. FW300-N1A1]